MQIIDVMVWGGATLIQVLLLVPVCEAVQPFEPWKAQVYPLITPTWSIEAMLQEPTDEERMFRQVRPLDE